MLVQINTHSSMAGDEALLAQTEAVVRHALDHFTDHITRVEVHLKDENRQKAGADDKRCLVEARLRGRQPIAVSHQAATFEQATSGAAKKMKNALETVFGRLRNP